ncbi:Oligoribonuclease [Frankliniella fusca]|uniref:Oligoribonuclease n=1 Tax=Frankliniella fusca TaxID=407009 RepID=A0AAE1HY52_9NEOP|nr:Oligoribonuclease [Frankliniella fusca]
MLQAEEISLGRDDSGRQKYAHYISVKDTLLRMFNDASVQNQIEDSFQRESKPNIFQDFSDGSVIKDHPIIKNVKCIQIILFQDAYEFFPLSPTAGTYKCVGFYFVLGNMDPNSRSQVDVIQLIEIVKEKDLKYFGTEYCLKKLLDELKVLAETGIMFKGETLPVIVTHMCGDNLGQNFIGSYVECFNTYYFCRFCEITRAQIKKDPSRTNPLRTPEDYDKTVRELELENKKIKKGIKGNSVLNEIPFFHVCNPGQPPCIAHDILEGIGKKDFALYLKYFIEVRGWIDFVTLDKKIKNFKCLGRDAADSLAPLDIDLRKIRGHASEVWVFIRMFPFLIGEYIQDQDDQVWQLCLKLKLICEYVFAPQISTKQIVKLKELIGSYVSVRSALFSKELQPKHHLICHYPELITYFGPLIRLWTLRFEARHMFFKNAAKSANNFINITKTLANKYVLNFAYKFSGSLLSTPISFRQADASIIVMDQIVPDIVKLLREDLNFNQTLQSVSVHGTLYTPGLWVLLGSERKNLLVGEIVLILYNGSGLKFLVKVHQATNSFKGYYCILEDYDYASVLQDKLEDFYPLSAYQYQGHQCLTLKHSSPFVDQ